MSWIQENKFVTGLAVVTAVVGGAILFYSNSQSNAYDEKMLEYKEQKTKKDRLSRSKTYPNAANLKRRDEGIKKYSEVIDEVRAAFSTYQPGKLPSLSPEQFSDAQVKMEKELREAFKDAGTTIPEGCNFGFEKYAQVQAKAGATAKLNYQLGAMRWLLGLLAETRPEALINIKRKELAIERGKVGEPAASRPRGRKGRSQRSSAETIDANAYEVMPVELAFTASESSVREFLKQMVNSEDYFFSIRALRIINEKQAPPTVNDAGFAANKKEPAKPSTNTPFGDLGFPGVFEEKQADQGGVASPAIATKPVVKSERILKQVLGAEKLNVYLSFDILLIKGDKADKGAAAPEGG